MKLVQHSPNFHCLVTKKYEVWFSYETPIAIRTDSFAAISENKWGVTTGRHLNYIDPDKSIRIPHEELMGLIKLIT